MEQTNAILEMIKALLASKGIVATNDHSTAGLPIITVGRYNIGPMLMIYDTDDGSTNLVQPEQLAECLASDNPIEWTSPW